MERNRIHLASASSILSFNSDVIVAKCLVLMFDKEIKIWTYLSLISCFKNFIFNFAEMVKGIDIIAINRPEKRPQIHCFFSYTMKPDASKLSSTIDYIFDLAWASF